MKQVIFLCLLSFTICLTKAAEPVTPKLEENASQKNVSSNATVLASVPPQNQNASKAEDVKLGSNNSTIQNIHEGEIKPTIPPSDNTTKTKDEKTDLTTSTTIKPVTSSAPPVKPDEGKNGTQNGTKPDGNNTVHNGTSPGAPPKPEDGPAKPAQPKSDEVQHIVQARGFDGPSFIGGIILTLGLLAIGFMGFKYYKNQTERNYHTL